MHEYASSLPQQLRQGPQLVAMEPRAVLLLL